MNQVFKSISKFVGAVLGIFSEQNPASMIRFLSFCMFIIATDLTYKLILTRTGPLGQYDFYTIIGLYSLAFFPKVIQKFMERGITTTSIPTVTVPMTDKTNYQDLQP